MVKRRYSNICGSRRGLLARSLNRKSKIQNLKSKMKMVLLLLLTLCFVPGLAGPVHGGDVAVIKSSGADVYQESLEGFRQTIRHRIVAEYDMREEFERGRKALAKLQSTVNPNLIFTLGPSALQVAADKTNSLPVVYAMVFNPSSIIGAERKNITGVSMNVSVKETVKIFSELSPKIRRVGVVFNPAKTGYLVMQATLAARKQGMELITREIRSTKTAIQAVRSLQDKIDALWVLPDETVLADEVLQYMLLFSYQNKIPVLGLSERHTQMGALLSLSYGSSKDMGRQAGEIANRIFRGSKPESIPYTTPRQVKLTANLKAARKLEVEIPDSILGKADNAVNAPVYEDGDWWVFRVEKEGTPPKEYRVTYKNGKFVSDDPDFLTGNEDRDSLVFDPLVSVHLSDSQRRGLDFPLIQGKKWSFLYRHTGGYSGVFRWWSTDAEVIGLVPEPMETPAGKFEVIEIRRTDWAKGTRELTYFYSPETKSVVKVLRAGTRKWGEVKQQRRLELIKYGHKEPVVQAPVYEDGDWWVFRVQEDQKRPWNARVTYKDGKFESDVPFFLRGEDNPENPRFLAFASVYLNDPQRKWLDFPLVPDKKWSFRYPFEVGGTFFRDKYRVAEAEVVGPVAQPMKTPAGSFNVIKIRRTDWGGKGWSDLTYNYSPETKSVVKLTADRSGGNSERHYEMELIKYGRGATTSEQPVVKAPTNR